MHTQWVSLKTASEAWAALMQQEGMSDGEVVDLLTHQLQTAQRLVERFADDELVVAGLLHDLGDGRVPDKEHAKWAADLVRPLLGDRIAWLINAHADAKRYLCTTNKEYFGRLSHVSQETFKNQGGMMSNEEVAQFEAHKWFKDALTLRECDDTAKDPNWKIDNHEYFKNILFKVVEAR